MLLSEHLLLNEAFEDEKNLIFDNPELIQAAKRCFVFGDVSCHALDLARHSTNKYTKNTSVESHKKAIGCTCPEEYKIFAQNFNELAKKINYLEKIGDYQTRNKFNKRLEEYRNSLIHAVQPSVREEKVERLFPYSQSSEDKTISCVYVPKNGTNRYKIIVNIYDNVLVTVYSFSSADLLRRAIEFESIELLKLEKFGKLDVPAVDVYYAIKTLESSLLTTMKKDKLMAKFFKDIGVAPQVKQQAIRKFEEELRNRQV